MGALLPFDGAIATPGRAVTSQSPALFFLAEKLLIVTAVPPQKPPTQPCPLALTEKVIAVTGTFMAARLTRRQSTPHRTGPPVSESVLSSECSASAHEPPTFYHPPPQPDITTVATAGYHKHQKPVSCEHCLSPRGKDGKRVVSRYCINQRKHFINGGGRKEFYRLIEMYEKGCNRVRDLYLLVNIDAATTTAG